MFHITHLHAFIGEMYTSLYCMFVVNNTVLIGSCCDLREHECKPHNRGLNNKCYDDCMCEEGECHVSLRTIQNVIIQMSSVLVLV